ncbi:MAG: hypothetical protein JO108_26395 [Acidobacteriaceae bacterium]|nr:hypothetical protein [Acidobacteriaceae bacterium]
MAKLGETIRIVRSIKPEHARTFAKTVVPEVVRPARVIWNQAIGAVFTLFAVSFFSYSAMHRDNPAGVAFGIFLGAVMTFFAITSFLRARNINRR